MKILTIIGHAAIILFCLWHMAAVALYALPDPAQDRVTVWLRDRAVPFVRPYIYVTSQWQQWNLFSPDPLRRASEYTLVRETADGKRETLIKFDRHSLSWWRSTHELVGFRKVEDAFTPNVNMFIARMMLAYCAPFHVPEEDFLRIVGRYSILPKRKPGSGKTLDWWTNWQPYWYPIHTTTVSCRGQHSVSPVILP